MPKLYQVLLSVFVSAAAATSMNDAIPAGSIIAHAVGTVPEGFLECNGDEVHKDDYPDLFKAIGTSYGSTRSTYFKVPDLRGSFVRGWDHGRGLDPHASSRGNRGDGGKGSLVGTTQDDSTRMPRNGLTTSNTGSHTHSGSADTAGEHSHTNTAINFDGGQDTYEHLKWGGAGTIRRDGAYAGSHSHSLSIKSNGTHSHTVNGGDPESRPVNTYLMYLIKAKNSDLMETILMMSGDEPGTPPSMAQISYRVQTLENESIFYSSKDYVNEQKEDL